MQGFDPTAVVFAGVPLLIFIIGAIELTKPYLPNLPGWVWLVASFCLGVLGQVVVYINGSGVPVDANAWVYLVTTGVLTGAAAAKAYDETIKPARDRAIETAKTETAVAMAAGSPVVMYLKENAGINMPLGAGAVVALNGTEFMLIPVTAPVKGDGLSGGGTLTAQDVTGWRIDNDGGDFRHQIDADVSPVWGVGEVPVTHGFDELGGPDVPEPEDVIVDPSPDLDVEPVPEGEPK